MEWGGHNWRRVFVRVCVGCDHVGKERAEGHRFGGVGAIKVSRKRDMNSLQ